MQPSTKGHEGSAFKCICMTSTYIAWSVHQQIKVSYVDTVNKCRKKFFWNLWMKFLFLQLHQSKIAWICKWMSLCAVIFDCNQRWIALVLPHMTKYTWIQEQSFCDAFHKCGVGARVAVQYIHELEMHPERVDVHQGRSLLPLTGTGLNITLLPACRFVCLLVFLQHYSRCYKRSLMKLSPIVSGIIDKHFRNFYKNPITDFWVILLTDRQTNKCR